VDAYDDTPETAPPLPRSVASIEAAEVRKLRSTNAYKRLRDAFRRSEANDWTTGRQGAPCWLCGNEIDYRLAYPHPYSWSLDHAVAMKHRPDLLMVTGNFRSAHLDCNTQRGTDAPKLDIGIRSERS
jgi:hypothetical protein